MQLLPQVLTSETGKGFRNNVFQLLKTVIEPVGTDTRDHWPADASKYIKIDELSKGDFGDVRVALCRDSTFGFNGPEARRCVMRKVYFKRKIEAFIVEKAKNRNEPEQIVTVDEKLYRFWRRTVMDVYILTRCRHENLMHAHSVFISDNDLTIILPRFYVLKDLINMYRTRHNADPMPMSIIGKIIRQLCIGLAYLNSVGIAHRDVQPNNVFLTRNGTVKLGHFGQARSNAEVATCITPVGNFEFMAYEKQFNFKVQNKKDCLQYTATADTWSLGVLILQMVSYFPDEPYHKLPKDFAELMHDEKMPFGWLIANMMQLRSRLSKSGGEELKSFLSYRLLTISEAKRATPAEILQCPEMKQWCLPDVDEDKLFLRKNFINDLDFANQQKLEADAPNYDGLESKNILPEFYWDDRWRILDNMRFWVEITVRTSNCISAAFRWGDPAPLFRILNKGVTEGYLDLADFLLIEPAVDKLAFSIVECANEETRKLKHGIKKEVRLELPPMIGTNQERSCVIVLKNEKLKRRDSLGWSTDSDDEKKQDKKKTRERRKTMFVNFDEVKKKKSPL